MAALAAGVQARQVNCTTCQQPPFSWDTADFQVSVSDPTGRGGTVSSVDAVVRNMTRGGELGRNRIPNTTTGISNTVVPASGVLTIPMGIVFEIPPPRDDVQMTVTVTLTR